MSHQNDLTKMEKDEAVIPLVSIIMSSFNHELFIEDALKSIFDQSYTNIEIILCDNCSSDDTFHKALNYCQAMTAQRNIRCVVKKNIKNLGPTRSLNRCLEFAMGNYFFLLFTDDYLHKDCVSKFMDHANQNKLFKGVYFCETIDVDLKKNILRSRNLDFLGAGGVVDKQIFWDSLYDAKEKELMVVPLFGSIVDLRNLGSFDINYYAGEWDLYIRSNGGPGIFYVPEKLYYFRKVPKSAGSRTLEYADGLLDAVIKYKVCFGDQYESYLFKTKLRVLRLYLMNYNFGVALKRLFKYLRIEKDFINSLEIVKHFIFIFAKCIIRYMLPVAILNFYTFKIKKPS